jgi:hypothetical protein
MVLVLNILRHLIHLCAPLDAGSFPQCGYPRAVLPVSARRRIEFVQKSSIAKDAVQIDWGWIVQEKRRATPDEIRKLCKARPTKA